MDGVENKNKWKKERIALIYSIWTDYLHLEKNTYDEEDDDDDDKDKDIDDDDYRQILIQ